MVFAITIEVSDGVMATSGKPVASAKPASGCPCVEGGRAQWQGHSRPEGWCGRGC
eukprot:COSAG02_NODE_67861_length_252_cov_0.601307_1_plen_54_part_01